MMPPTVVKHLLRPPEAYDILVILAGRWSRPVTPEQVASKYYRDKIEPWMKAHSNGSTCQLVNVRSDVEGHENYIYYATLNSISTIELTLVFDDLTVATLFKLIHA